MKLCGGYVTSQKIRYFDPRNSTPWLSYFGDNFRDEFRDQFGDDFRHHFRHHFRDDFLYAPSPCEKKAEHKD